MKTIKLLSLFLASAFVLSSCSNNETLLPETAKTSLLKSYKVKRDASGAYSVDFNLAENTKSNKVKNIETNSNDFHLYESDFSSAKRQSEELIIDGNKLSVGFVDTNTGKNPYITIEDENVFLANTAAKKTEMLNEYSISSNEDGTFNLDFSVNNKVSVDFIYNEDNGIYEIHLEEGKSSETSFSRNLVNKDDKVLKIDFIHHLTKDTAAKGYTLESETTKRKPRIVVDNGESSEGLSS